MFEDNRTGHPSIQNSLQFIPPKPGLLAGNPHENETGKIISRYYGLATARKFCRIRYID
jgi:hypothetical protein